MNIHPCARTCAAGRGLLVKRILEQGWAIEAAAEAAGISKRTAYKWLRRFKLEGAAGLVDRNSRPHHSPTRLQLEKAHIVQFQCAMHASMCSRSATLLGKCATPSNCSPRMPKKPSTWFSHDALVGV